MNAGELIISGLLFVFPNVPLILTVVVLDTGRVEIVNVATVRPAGTVTLAGTVAFTLSEPRVTIEPPTGAGPLSVTVPVELVPPCKLLGETAMAAKLGCATIRL